MSVGYDLEGIQSPKIDAYIEGMRNAQASDVWVECQTWALANLSRFEKIDAAFVEAISPKVCDSITLSTLHGCPPEEIERIAVYLLDNKKLNTYIKCNPTLLGYEFARSTMDEMGYDELQFDDHHFRDDLQYADAVPMIRRLLALAKEKGVEFGVKLTNTFPVEIAHGELPGQEMYMSGRSLYPLSIALAAKLEKDFAGRLRVSYSGGADACNITALFGCGIWPITMATTLLKPGGYNRLCQMANALADMPYAPFSGVDTKRLSQLAQDARADVRYRRPAKHGKNRKLASKAPLLDCFVASCQENCPIHQDIPAYLQLVAEGRYEQALAVICEKNPLPFITGTICNHRCQAACTRNFYEEAVHIRDAKLTAAQNGFDGYLKTVRPAKRKDALSVAVVGGGPGGMAAAFLAARAGARVVLFERSESLGGVVKHVIPEFRIPASAIAQDARLLAAMGVDIRLNAPVLCADELAGYDHVIVAVGAGKHLGLKLAEGQALNAIDFLTAAKSKPSAVAVQGKVIVVGGGNTAMDAARAATRLPGVTGVSIVYRRQMRQMPADLEELELAMSEGVALRELLSPISHRNGALLCDIMRLGAPGADGRQSPECTGETVEIPADCVIAAIGEKPDEEAIAAFGDRVTVIGDAKRGPATVVEAIADATAAVERLLAVHPASVRIASGALQAKRGVLRPCDGSCDAQRCLGCDLLCENCVDVCPNRANAVVMIDGR
ncbi:MAG: putative selenate reductase subunit YgfK, partial [Clostridia bacterium]